MQTHAPSHVTVQWFLHERIDSSRDAIQPSPVSSSWCWRWAASSLPRNCGSLETVGLVRCWQQDTVQGSTSSFLPLRPILWRFASERGRSTDVKLAHTFSLFVFVSNVTFNESVLYHFSAHFLSCFLVAKRISIGARRIGARGKFPLGRRKVEISVKSKRTFLYVIYIWIFVGGDKKVIKKLFMQVPFSSTFYQSDKFFLIFITWFFFEFEKEYFSRCENCVSLFLTVVCK